MTPYCISQNWYWIPWLLIVAGWGISIWNTQTRAKNAYLTKAIDDFAEAVGTAEIMGNEYWSQSGATHKPFQLYQTIRTISYLAKSISEADTKQPYPSKKIATLRRITTLNMEDAELPLSPTDSRFQSISSASHALIYHYKKKF